MALDLLGNTLDIHCGGTDLIFPHHEDEIAQSEAATGQTFARMWCHGAFLLTDGAKMAKRLGNVSTVKDMRESRIPAAAIRHFVFNTHYRKELNFTEEGLEASLEAVRRIGDFAERLRGLDGRELGVATGAAGGTPLEAAAEEAAREAEVALFDDLNAPRALAALFVFIKRANAELDRGFGDASAVAAARAAFARIDGVLDLVPERGVGEPTEVAWVEERLAARRAARARRDFPEADRIRRELVDGGIAIEDTSQGTKWKRLR
jgi:cysteinyl-tRNA synthetase